MLQHVPEGLRFHIEGVGADNKLSKQAGLIIYCQVLVVPVGNLGTDSVDTSREVVNCDMS